VIFCSRAIPNVTPALVAGVPSRRLLPQHLTLPSASLRHCERSEAIQGLDTQEPGAPGLLRHSAPRNDAASGRVSRSHQPHPQVSSRASCPGPTRLPFCRSVDWTPATSAGVTLCFGGKVTGKQTPFPLHRPLIPLFSAPETGPNPAAEIREEFPMRAETQTLADEIKQSLALLRRHL
jgi:hypothetical protein